MKKIIVLMLFIVAILSCSKESMQENKNSNDQKIDLRSEDGYSENNLALLDEFLSATQGISSENFQGLESPLNVSNDMFAFGSMEDKDTYLSNVYAFEDLWEFSEPNDEEEDQEFVNEPINAIENYFQVSTLESYYDSFESEGFENELSFFMFSPDDQKSLNVLHEAQVGETIYKFYGENKMVAFDSGDESALSKARAGDFYILNADFYDFEMDKFEPTFSTRQPRDCWVFGTFEIEDLVYLSEKEVNLKDLNIIDLMNEEIGSLRADWTIEWGDGKTSQRNDQTNVNINHTYGFNIEFGECETFTITVTAEIVDELSQNCPRGTVLTRLFTFTICNDMIIDMAECDDDPRYNQEYFFYDFGSKKYRIRIQVSKKDIDFWTRTSSFVTTVTHRKRKKNKWKQNKATELNVRMMGEYFSNINGDCGDPLFFDIYDPGHNTWKNTAKISEGIESINLTLLTRDNDEAPEGRTQVLTNGVIHDFGPVSIYD